MIATGGCAFQSGGLGCNVLTGDGHLMAAELGAELSGMEFSNAYAISPTFSSVTKTAFYRYATFYTDDGILEGAGAQRGRSIIARELLTRPVYARLDRAPEDIRRDLRSAQPNFFLPFDREGINPFTEKFPVTMRLEGTVRGTGGLRVVDENCATNVPGLYAAGDASTRELICGGFTGGGSHNAAWAISSGSWAGQARRRYAVSPDAAPRRSAGRIHELRAAGAAGMRACGPVERSLTPGVDRPGRTAGGHPLRSQPVPHRDGLSDSLGRLDDLWKRARSGLQVESEPRTDGGDHASPRIGGDGRPRPLDVLGRTAAEPKHAACTSGPTTLSSTRHSSTGTSSADLTASGPHRSRAPLQRTGDGRMIELVSEERCIKCDACIRVCPTNVFEHGPDRLPVIKRQADCQTCFMCEAWCPTDALFVAPQTEPVAAESPYRERSVADRARSARQLPARARLERPAPAGRAAPQHPAPDDARAAPDRRDRGRRSRNEAVSPDFEVVVGRGAG